MTTPDTPHPTIARERATAFILSLPKFEGHQQAHPSNPEKSKLYRELIEKLEREFIDALVADRKAEPKPWLVNMPKAHATLEHVDEMPDDIRDQVAQEARERMDNAGIPHLPQFFFDEPKVWGKPKPTLLQRIKAFFGKG